MKRFLSALLVAAFLAAGTTYAAEDMVFVDLQEVFKRFYKTQLAQDQIRQQHDDIRIEREEMEEEVKVLKEEVEVFRTDARDETLSEELRDDKRNQLEEKLVGLQKKEQEMIDFEKLRMQQLEQQNTRMTKKLFDEIHDAIIRHAREKNYDSVIDRSAQSRIGTEMVLYTNPKVDITAELLAVLNEGREEIQQEKEQSIIAE
jgi:Skp family chaperone for outer membrane proteins